VNGMTLPREFRRLRVLLLGFGDVAKRLARQRLSKTSSRHGPRFIAASRSAAGASQGMDEMLRKSRSQWLSMDLDQRNSATRLACLGQMAIIFFPPHENQNERIDSRTRLFANAIRRAQQRMPMVYLSTTGVYGNRNGGRVDETSTCRPGQARSQRRLDAERRLRPLGAHVLRVPGIYAQDRLPVARLKAHTPALRKEEDVFTNHIHADDLAAIAWKALFHGRKTRITNTVDNSRMTMGEYFDAVAQALGLQKPPRVSLQEMKELAQAGSISPMALSFFLESRQVVSGRLEKELGVHLAYPDVASTLATLPKA
jgi:nucleoside-diphosphate-sugar epimerase